MTGGTWRRSENVAFHAVSCATVPISSEGGPAKWQTTTEFDKSAAGRLGRCRAQRGNGPEGTSGAAASNLSGRTNSLFLHQRVSLDLCSEVPVHLRSFVQKRAVGAPKAKFHEISALILSKTEGPPRSRLVALRRSAKLRIARCQNQNDTPSPIRGIGESA